MFLLNFINRWVITKKRIQKMRSDETKISKIPRMSKKFIWVCHSTCSHCRQFHLNTKMPVKYITMCFMFLSLATDSVHSKCQGANSFARASCVFCHPVSLHSFISLIWDCSFRSHSANSFIANAAHCLQHHTTIAVNKVHNNHAQSQLFENHFLIVFIPFIRK